MREACAASVHEKVRDGLLFLEGREDVDGGSFALRPTLEVEKGERVGRGVPYG